MRAPALAASSRPRRPGNPPPPVSCQIREYLALKLDPSEVQPGGDAQLAASASLALRELQAAVAQLAASRDLSAAEAELANANLALLVSAGGAPDAGSAAAQGVSGGEQQRRHVWYGDPLLSSSDSRHSVAVRRREGVC